MRTKSKVKIEEITPTLLPDEVLEQVARARASGKFIIACWYIDGQELKFFRNMANEFPVGDLGEAINLLERDLGVKTPNVNLRSIPPLLLQPPPG